MPGASCRPPIPPLCSKRGESVPGWACRIEPRIRPRSCWSDGTDAINASETDCLADDAVRIETVSRPVLPAICDLQGDFQKLQGE